MFTVECCNDKRQLLLEEGRFPLFTDKIIHTKGSSSVLYVCGECHFFRVLYFVYRFHYTCTCFLTEKKMTIHNTQCTVHVYVTQNHSPSMLRRYGLYSSRIDSGTPPDNRVRVYTYRQLKKLQENHSCNQHPNSNYNITIIITTVFPHTVLKLPSAQHSLHFKEQ